MKLPKPSHKAQYLVAVFILIFANFIFAQPGSVIPINQNWNFQGQSVSGLLIDKTVDIPHTWNANDAQEGIAYYRGDGVYFKNFIAEENWQGMRIFLRFEGVNIISKTYLNEQEIGVHKGGYAAFCYELTDFLKYGEENTLKVEVNNEQNLEVIPLVGDFNNYGGIYRPVSLIITNPICISLLDYASPGVYLQQKKVSTEMAEIEVLTKISSKLQEAKQITLDVNILDAEGQIISNKKEEKEISEGESNITIPFTITNPHLWHGKKDPYMYKVQVDLLENGQVLDSRTEPLGLRFFNIDANQGFFLNGEHISLRGVSRHQDRINMGSAITDKEHQEDMDIMLEMGINALRLAHYQHAEKVYDLADSAGLIVWAELPWVGSPGGFFPGSNGYEDTEAFKSNAKQQLHELIRQNFNHPSIVMWSIFNEIQNPEEAQPTEFIKTLNAIVKEEDPSRLSVGASMLNPEKNPNIHEHTDAIAWNKYFGWYYNEPQAMAEFLDNTHAKFPDYKIGVSEYGAGGSIYQHTDELKRPNPMGSPHPEEWQSYYHEEHLKIFDERSYIWGTFLWNMFDFGSHFRREGDHFGINDKGMVTYDRKVKKDAFYLYKANLSEEPVLHITSSRYIFRKDENTSVKVYTNLPNVSVSVNGEFLPKKSPEKGIIIWENIKLQPGNNGIIAKAEKDGKVYLDDCVWLLESPYKGMNLFIKIMDLMNYALQIAMVGLFLAVFIWFFGIRKLNKSQKFSRFILWTFVILIFLCSVLVLGFQILMSQVMGS
ncbi:glycoside hydrolase family 2 protein [Flexithrix dorotheae]|uniref:glycoside hydrolase family 2 protein n=1 Tax=Flexithrix dorotheae TaxID=70993 RepID=UPI000374DB2B|nr:glycoside hydrolase family 2 [Flexithrix dorotheae]